ncbi:hypothetical protein [Hymenobacter sp.]|uniref:hypothetical protein n=1 Tax=Hymenobacter sp. TaxID=1898978 RepID=UPI002869F0AB|nr:hypothetical protein [Hymenobacter sp.]
MPVPPLPPLIEQFLTQNPSFEQPVPLPDRYANPAQFDLFQAGYRYNANTNESLVGTKFGDFQESWYVVASSYFADPFIVDLDQAAAGYPVYYSPHGAGRWTLVPVAESLAAFSRLLADLSRLLPDRAQAASYLRAQVDGENEFWQEVLSGLEEEM